jgi:hypothetical protein
MTWIASGAVKNSAIGRSRGGFKKGDGVGRKRGSEFYSVYSVFWHFEATIEISVVCWSECVTMVVIVLYYQMTYNFPSGRHGFESRLPLHVFNKLQRYCR